MKLIPAPLLTLALALGLTPPGWADLISPGKALARTAERNLPLLLVLALLIATAVLVRHFTKKK